MAELADALDLGSSGQPCGFDPHYPYHAGAKDALLRRFYFPGAKDVIRLFSTLFFFKLQSPRYRKSKNSILPLVFLL